MDWQSLREKAGAIPKKVAALSGKLDGKKKKWLIVAGVAVLIIAITGAILLNRQTKDVLFTGLNEQEVSEVVAKVQEMGVSASFDDQGNISVPDDQVDSLRAQLAMDGYPRSGLSYNVFSSNVGIMSTEFDRQAYKLYDLQDRIAGTLRCFDGVKDAVVTIDRGDESKYAIGSTQKEPTASVTLTMYGGGSLTEQQAEAVRHLVMKSVSGLKDENIAVADTSGRNYTAQNSDSTDSLAKLKMELENQIDSTIQKKIFDLLSPICGPENLRVSVRSQVDVAKKVQEITNYKPVTGSAVGVPSSQTQDVEISGQGQAAEGTPGTDTNAQVPIYPEVTFDGENLYYKNGLSTEYLVDQLKEQIINGGGDLADLTVTVTMDAQDLTNRDVANIREAVGNAAGIAPESRAQKVIVLNQPFIGQAAPTFSETLISMVQGGNILWIVIAGVVLALLVAILMTMLKSRKKKKLILQEQARLAAEAEARALAQAAAKEEEEEFDLTVSLDELKQSREMELKEQIRDFAQNNPEISAQLIKTWLKGGENDG